MSYGYQFRLEFAGPSAAIGAIVAFWWVGIISPWWLILAAVFLVKFPTTWIHWRSGRGWSVSRGYGDDA